MLPMQRLIDSLDLALSGDDGVFSFTFSEQREVELAIAHLLRERCDDSLPFYARMQRDVHQNYLLSGLEGLPSYMRSLDASRPWLVFWILHSLSLLNRLHHVPQLTLMNCIDFLKRCQHPRGGFGGGPGQLPHLAPTYAATMALATIGGRVALDVINRPAMIEFLMRLKDPITGAFHVHENGEADVRGTYTALAVASMLNLLTPELTKDTASFLLSCQRYEGGFGGEPGNEAHGGYTYCAFASLVILGETKRVNLPALMHWASMRQMRLEGGFSGRTNKLVDGCYSFWVGSLFPLIETALRAQSKFPFFSTSVDTACESDVNTTLNRCNGGWLYDPAALQRYLLVCCQDDSGGLVDKPGKNADFYHTCYCLSGLATSQHTGQTEAETLLGSHRDSLKSTHPVYNIEDTKAIAAFTYFHEHSSISST